MQNTFTFFEKDLEKFVCRVTHSKKFRRYLLKKYQEIRQIARQDASSLDLDLLILMLREDF